MAECKKCGAEIVWTKTENSKSMPLDPGEVALIESRQGSVLAVTEGGRVVRGDIVSDNCENGYILARIIHFATCPFADDFRRKNR